MMVRFAVVCCAFLALLFPAPAARAADPLPVVTALPAQKYLIERIAGDAVRVTTLLDKGADPHTFEPAPSDMRAVAGARLYFSIGLPFEDAWLPRLAGSAPNLKVVSMIAGIKRLTFAEEAAEAPTAAAAEHEDHDHTGEDPHVWLSPMLVRAMLPNIVRALSAELPDQAARFRASAKALDEELQSLDAELADIFAPIPPERRAFLSLHPSWRYFSHNYQLTELSVEVDGKEPSPGDMRRIVDLAKRYNLHTVFVEPQQPRAAAEAVAAAIGANIVTINPLDGNLPQLWRSTAKALAASFPKQRP